MPSCGNQLFSLALDPDGTSFWTGDTSTGNIYRVDIASGAVLKTISTFNGALYGLSLVGEPGAASGIPEGGVLTAAEGYDGGAPTECACLSTNGNSGDPVNPMDGDFYENDTDLSQPGPGVALGFSRSYDAMAAQAGVTGPLGPGWSDNLNMSIAVNPTTSIATVTEDNGAQVTFEPYDASVSWCPSSKNYCPTAPRNIATLNHNGDGTWTFTNDISSPLTYLFSSSGGLEQITNAAGQSIAGSSEAPGTGSGASACPSSAATCTVWLSNASTPNPTLTEIFDSASQLIQLNGFATSGGTAPSVTFCYYGETACSPPSSGGLAGSLYSVTDPGGLTTTYTYDATNSTTQYQNDLLTRTDPDTHQLTNTYNTSGQISQQTDPNGQVSTFTYAETSGVAPGDGVDNTTTVSTSPGTGLPTQSTEYTYTYGELISTTLDPGGSSPSVTTSVRSPITGQITTAIDANGNTSATDLPNPISGTFLGAIDPTDTTDALGNTTLYAYTSTNQVWCEVEPAELANGVTCPSTQPTTAPTPGTTNTVDLGATITYHDAAGNPTYVTDPLGNTTETAYTTAEQPWCSVDAAEFTTAGKYCPSTPASSPPTGTVTGYTTTVFDAAGRQTSVTTPNGATTTYGYTNASFPDTVTTSTDPQGDVIATTLDTAGRPVSQVQTFGSFSATTVTAYDAAGRAFCTIGPLAYWQGDTSCPTSEPTSAPTAGTDPWPGQQITIFNGAGQPLDQINPLGGVTQTAYNGAGQTYCSVSPTDYATGTTCPSSPPTSAPTGTATGYTTTIYDANGQVASVTDPLGDTTASTYDLAGNLIASSVTPANTTHDPVQGTDYQFNADDQQVASCSNADGVALDAPGTCGQASVHSVSCASTTTCVGVDDAANFMVLSGTAWGAPTPITAEKSAGHVPSALSCPTTTFCMAVDNQGDALSFNGTSWAGSLTSVDTQALTGVTCGSATFCMAFDSAGDVSTFNGTSWTTPANPDTGGTITSMSCSSTTFCMAVDSGGNYLTFNGTTWGSPTNEDGPALTEVSCVSASFCGATASDGTAFIDTSGTWSFESFATPFAAVSCVATTCRFASKGGNIDTYDGTSWSGVSVDGGVAFTSLWCASSTMCEASDASASILGYNGSDWTATPGLDEPASSADTTTLSSFDPNGDVYCTVSAKTYAKGPKAYQCPAWQAGWIATPPSPSSLYSSTPSSSQANNVSTSFDDPNGDQLQSTNPDAQTTIDALDADGRAYCSADATNVASWLSAHSSGSYPYLCPSSPPTSAPGGGSNPGYVTTIYDAQGNSLSSTDQAGDTTAYTYNASGQTLTTTDPRGEVTTGCYYSENSSGQCANAAPSSGGLGSALYSTTTPITNSDPSGGLTVDTYLPGGQNATSTSPAGTTSNGYDVMGNLTSVSTSNAASGYSSPGAVSYAYNQDGSRHTMADATGTTTYAYDDNGDVTSQALAASPGLASTTTSYGYDAAGVLGSVTYPSYSGHSSPQVTYAYDSSGAMTSSTDWLGNQVTFAHDGDGNTTGQDNNVSGTNPNGTSSTAFSYDLADQNRSATSTINQTCGSSETVSQSFSGSGGSRNADGQLTQYGTSYSASCSGQTSASVYYSYDLVGRVVYQGATAQGSNPATFVYDASGDPTTMTNHDSSGGIDTYSQSYDAAGEPTSQSHTAGPGGTSSTYSYDTLGNRTQAQGGSSTSNYGYNPAGQMSSASTTSGSSSYLYTGDGLEGASVSSASVPWGPPTDVNASRAFDALSCAAANFCVAVGASGYASVYNGTSWSAATDVDGSRTLDAVSCPSTTFCAAVDTNGHGVTYNGTSWSAAADIDASRSVNAVSCTSSSFCIAAGASGYVTKYDGTSWSTPSNVDSTRGIDALKCTSSTFCMAVDTSGYALTFGSSGWSSPSDVDGARNIDALSCTSSTFCAAVDTSGYALTYGTSGWSSPSDVDSTRSIDALSCTSASFCVAVDTSGYAVSYGTSGWGSPSDIDGSNALKAISCASATLCQGVDGSGNVLSFNGSTWSSALDVDGSRSIDAVSCATATFCALSDTSGYVAVYALESQAWNAASAVDAGNAITGLSCSSSTFCAAVDGAGNAMTYNDTSWTSPSNVDSGRHLSAVSCTSSTFCMAVGASGYVVSFNGSSWTASDQDGTRTINAVDCTSSTFCVAVGNTGYALVYGGSSWTATDVDASRNLNAVSCTSSNVCAAAGTSGYAVAYSSGWGTATDVDAARTLDAAGCATSSTFCVVAGAGGYAASYTSSGWSASPTDIDGTRTVQVVNCPSSTACVATDAMGYAITYGTSGWASPNQIDNGHALQAASCGSSTFCEVVDSSGQVLTYNGTSWTVQQDVDGTNSLVAVSCTSTTFCAAGDGSGSLLTYAPQPIAAASQLTWNTNGSLPLVLSDASSDYIYGPSGTPVEQISLTSSTPTYLTYSSSNDTWLSTNSAGDATGFWGYDAFGNLSFGTPTSAFGYSGQYADTTTSFVNDRARWYDTQTGGFTSRDLAFAATHTAYGYAGGDPVNSNDPTGMWRNVCSGFFGLGWIEWGNPGFCGIAGFFASGNSNNSKSGGGASNSPNASCSTVPFASSYAVLTIDDLYAAGNAQGPKVRPSDLNVESPEDYVHPQKDPTGKYYGASSFGRKSDLLSSVNANVVWKLPKGALLPSNLAIEADGSDYGGPGPSSHHTTYPTITMLFSRFNVEYINLGWVRQKN